MSKRYSNPRDLGFITKSANVATHSINFVVDSGLWHLTIPSTGGIDSKGHSKRVAALSEVLAGNLGLCEEEVAQANRAGFLHDVGLAEVPESILNKAGSLDLLETEMIRRHPERGFESVIQRVDMELAAQGVLFHHEKFDGSGYPFGLKGESIPMIARIIGLAESYDAMVNNQPYREAIDPYLAYLEIETLSGKHFCPAVVRAFRQAFFSDSDRFTC